MRRRELMLVLGGAMTAASGLRAQQKAMPVIGYLGGASPGPFGPFVAAFRQGRLCRGTKSGNRVSVGREQLRSPAVACRGSRQSRCQTDRDKRRSPAGTRGKKRDHNDPDCFVASDPVEQGLVTSELVVEDGSHRAVGLAPPSRRKSD
jgi:hypothetical protein